MAGIVAFANVMHANHGCQILIVNRCVNLTTARYFFSRIISSFKRVIWKAFKKLLPSRT